MTERSGHGSLVRMASVENKVTAEVEMAMKPAEKFPGLKSIKPEGEDK
jgi:hypothetical protein